MVASQLRLRSELAALTVLPASNTINPIVVKNTFPYTLFPQRLSWVAQSI
jgi:hypothetical protein